MSISPEDGIEDPGYGPARHVDGYRVGRLIERESEHGVDAYLPVPFHAGYSGHIDIQAADRLVRRGCHKGVKSVNIRCAVRCTSGPSPQQAVSRRKGIFPSQGTLAIRLVDGGPVDNRHQRQMLPFAKLTSCM